MILTPQKAVPREWFPPSMVGVKILGLASSGGQQLPLFAALGSVVTSLDLSPGQLALDNEVAKREGLDIQIEEGDMADLSRFSSGSFDLIYHPVSNCFVSDIQRVWNECFRVLKPGGTLLAGFINPLYYLFDYEKMLENRFELKYRIPYSDSEQLPKEELEELLEEENPLEFGHSLDAQLGGQLRSGFMLVDLYEDSWPEQNLDNHIALMMATQALKPS